MKTKQTIFMAIVLILLSCLALSSCGSASKVDLNNAAENIYKAAKSSINELSEEGVPVTGDYIISTNPNYNYYNGETGIESEVYKLYRSIASYYSDSDNYEYIFEVTSGWTGVNISQVYVAEKWESKDIGGYPTQPDSSNWPPYCMYLTNEFDTLQDIADSAGQLNGYEGSAYNFIENSYGYDTNGDDSLFDLSSFDYYELLDEIIKLFGSWAFRLFLVIFIVSLVWCFFGYQIFQVFAALSSLLIMSLFGLIATISSSSLAAFGICFVIGIILAIICAKSKGFSAFMIGVMNSLPITAIISMIVTQSVKNGLIIGLVISLIIGIITALIKKPLIILSSAIGFGSIAGTALACMIPNTKLCIVFQLILICIGVYVQTKIAHGLLESGSLIEHIKSRSSVGADKIDKSEEGSVRKSREAKESKPSLKKAIKSSGNSCLNCGATLLKDSKFCIKCGNIISEEKSNKSEDDTDEFIFSPKSAEESKKKDTTASNPDERKTSPIFSDESDIISGLESDSHDDSKLSLGGLGEKSSSYSSDGDLVINVDKTKEKKKTGNSHFISADDFDD